MRRTTPAALALALLALTGPGALAQQDKGNDTDKGRDASAGRETVRGVIAGVTVEGETAIDYATQRAATVEMSYLTVVGSPVHGAGRRADAGARDSDRDREKGRARARDGGERRRHNVYVLWLTPKTQVRDATGSGETGAGQQGDQNKDANQAQAGAFDKIEVGDRVEVTFTRREFPGAGGNTRDDARARRHGRHRTYFGDAVTIRILAMPDRDGDRDRDSDRPARGDQSKDRDDDKDKVKDR